MLCPPYDVISPEQQKLLYETGDHNAVRLELPLESPKPEGRYREAAATYRHWLRNGILRPDLTPGFYLHDHYFEYSGAKRRRRGLIARVKLDPRSVYPHEETHSEPKSDRLKLLRACRASFSPVLGLYRDREGTIAPLLSEASQTTPVVETPVSVPAGQDCREPAESHVLWAITDPETRLQLIRSLSDQRLYIGDGHHRYETALAYRQEQEQRRPDIGRRSPKAFQYVMMELVECSDPGLVLLPVHRLVRDTGSSALSEVEERLRWFFDLESVPLAEEPPAVGGCGPLFRGSAERRSGACDDSAPRFGETPEQSCVQSLLCREGDSRSAHGVVSGVLGLRAGTLVLLRLRGDVPLEQVMPVGRSRAYQEFSVSILNHVVLERTLGLSSEGDVVYTSDPEEACRQVAEGSYQLAFLLNRPELKAVKAAADAHDRMPGKSTYFHPKLPAGLVINPLD